MYMGKSIREMDSIDEVQRGGDNSLKLYHMESAIKERLAQMRIRASDPKTWEPSKKDTVVDSIKDHIKIQEDL